MTQRYEFAHSDPSTGEPCPRPDKRRFKQKRQAKRAVLKVLRIGHPGTVQPYRCVCGWWHLGKRRPARSHA